MVNNYIYEDFYKGQFKKQKYRIWSIMGRESVSLYWYVVMYDTTYKREYECAGIDIKSVDDKITNQAIDIRTLPNYTKFSFSDILFNRNEVIVPLIREALKKGFIKPF